MRLVTWNCNRGKYSSKVPLLDSLAPDIAVIQECGRPETISETCLWFGDNPNQGIAVRSSNGYRLRPLPVLDDIPRYTFPIEVSGPEGLLPFVVWSKGKQKFRYVMGVVKAIEAYRGIIEKSPCIVIGDLNSNAIWDSWHPNHLNHSALIGLLSDLRIVSSYHEFFGEPFGKETRPTCFLLKKEDRPYHIDYCFIPRDWKHRIREVHVGSFGEWRPFSDHCPLLVDLS